MLEPTKHVIIVLSRKSFFFLDLRTLRLLYFRFFRDFGTFKNPQQIYFPFEDNNDLFVWIELKKFQLRYI